MLKHYIERHKDIPMKEMKFRVKMMKSYKSAFGRQIGESVYINNNLRQGTIMMNSKNEYNRCIIPRLGINLDKDEWIEEYEESEKEKAIKREIQKMKEKLRYEKQVQKDKKLKLMKSEGDKNDKKMNKNDKDSEKNVKVT